MQEIKKADGVRQQGSAKGLVERAVRDSLDGMGYPPDALWTVRRWVVEDNRVQAVVVFVTGPITDGDQNLEVDLTQHNLLFVPGLPPVAFNQMVVAWDELMNVSDLIHQLISDALVEDPTPSPG